jgi:hypothetical protein
MLRNERKLKRGISTTEESSTDRLFSQILKSKEEKQEQNKENLQDDNSIRNVKTS